MQCVSWLVGVEGRRLRHRNAPNGEPSIDRIGIRMATFA
jgi:hypothetical protein